MKKTSIYLILLAFTLTVSSCKSTSDPVPTTPRLFYLPFSNNFTDTQSAAISTVAQGSFVNDATGTSNSAYYAAAGQKLSYSLATYPNLKLGVSQDFSIAMKFKYDEPWTRTEWNAAIGTPKFKYATFLEIGEGIAIRLFYGADGGQRLEFVTRTSQTIYTVSSAFSFANNTSNNGWHTLVFTYSKTDMVSKIYINGVETGTANILPNGSSLNVDYAGVNQNINIGNGDRIGHNFQGNLDNLAFYSGVLTSAEISAL